MNKNTLLVVAAIVGFLFWNGNLKVEDFTKHLPKSGGAASSAEEFPGMPADPRVAAAVEPVRAAMATVPAGDKLALARLWREQAKLIGIDTTIVKNTADVKRANGIAGQLMHLTSKNPALAAAANNAAKVILGDLPKPLDAAARQDAVNLFNGLSWAARN